MSLLIILDCFEIKKSRHKEKAPDNGAGGGCEPTLEPKDLELR